MIQWFNDLLFTTKVRFVIESILFCIYMILLLTKKAYFNIFDSDIIIINNGEAFYFINLLIFIFCISGILIRMICILYWFIFMKFKSAINNVSHISYLFLAKVYIDELYDNNWYYPVLACFYLFHLFFLEIPFCFLLTIFSRCMENDKNDKLYYYKKYSLSYKSRSLKSQDF